LTLLNKTIYCFKQTQSQAGQKSNGQQEELAWHIVVPRLFSLIIMSDLHEIGLPSFASLDNIALDSKVKAEQRYLAELNEELAQQEERLKIIEQHKATVAEENNHTDLLINAKQKEKDTETHLTSLAVREMGRISSEYSSIEFSLQSHQDAINSLHNAKFLAGDKLDKFQLAMNWNQEELLQWSLAAKQKSEDEAQLIKYKLQDNKKIKQLTLRLENLARINRSKGSELAESVTETQSIQIELDKVAAEYKKEHSEKLGLIRQWNEAKGNIYKRDTDITHISEQILLNKQKLKEVNAAQAEQQKFLAIEQDNNKNLTVKIESTERINEKARLSLLNSKNELISYEDQVQTLRTQLEKAESQLKLSQQQVQIIIDNKSNKEKQLQSLINHVEQARLNAEKEKNSNKSLQERNEEIEQLYKDNLLQQQQLQAHINKLKESQFKASQELFEARSEQTNLIAEISGAQSKSRNSSDSINRFDAQSLKQQEMLYNIEFQVQQLERKLSHAQGKRSIEDTTQLNHAIQQLSDQLGNLTKQYSLINNQNKRLEDQLRQSQRDYNNLIKQKGIEAELLNALNMENESIHLQFNQKNNSKESEATNNDLMKLEIKKLREHLNSRADEVLKLEERKFALIHSMKEREKEVELHNNVQRQQLKIGEESRHSLIMDLKDRQIKVEKLKSKFELLAAKLNRAESSEAGFNEEKSQAFFIIRAAQEREELQREGDRLNQLIQRGEKELLALQNTHQALNYRNEIYKAGFNKLSSSDEELQLKQELHNQNRSLIDKLYKQKNYLRELVNEFESRRNELAALINNLNSITNVYNEKQSQYHSLTKQVNDQISSLHRSERLKNNKFNEYRIAQGAAAIKDPAEINNYLNNQTAHQSNEELYINIQEKKRRNRLILHILQDFIQQNGQHNNPIINQLVHLATEYDININPAAQESSRPSSAASSILSNLSSASNNSSRVLPRLASRPLSSTRSNTVKTVDLSASSVGSSRRV
jgi:hypothetical protein